MRLDAMNTQRLEHTIKRFDAELQRLTREIADMGDAALAQIARALQALEQRDAAEARRVIEGDDAIDSREREISHEVLRVLALRQPGARDLRELGVLTCDIVHEVLRAWRAADAALAHAAWRRDDELDRMHAQFFHDMLIRMREAPSEASWCTHLLFVAKNLERIGDHATNVAENVWFVVEGEPGLS